MLVFSMRSLLRGSSLLVSFLLFAIASLPAYAAPKAELIKFWDDREPLSGMQVNHDAWQEILNQYVDDQHPSGINRFDYAAVSAGDALKLKRYIDYLEQMEPRQLNGDESQAFWINLYNALMVDKIVDAYQSRSKRTLNRLLKGGLRSSGWNKDIAEVVMQELSLDDIEHGILRPIWKDPRIHFVLVSGALSGANISKTAFDGDNNEALLEQAKADFLGHPKAVYVDGDSITLNSIFDWYRADFAPDKSALLSYIRANVPEAMRVSMQGISRTRYDFNWSLNIPDSDFVIANRVSEGG